MTRRVGFAEDAYEGPWDAYLRQGEEVIWTGRPDFGLATDAGTLWAMIPGFLGTIALFLAQFYNPGMAESLRVGPIQFNAILAALMLYMVIYFCAYGLTIPSLTRYALSTERAFIHRALPWPKIAEFDIGLTAPIKLTDRAIYFADETINHGQKLRRRAVGFRNIPPAEAEAIHDMLRQIQQRAIT